MDFTVVLDNPKYEGNIGFVARVMKNFGFSDLVLVGVDELGEEAKRYASNAQDVLESAEKTDQINEVFDRYDLRVATTGIRGKSEDRFKRNPYLNPQELKTKLDGKNGKCGLFFGREDHGLNNKIVKKCEIVLSIPSNEEYPILNLSHAVSIVLYELNNLKDNDEDLANRDELDSVNDRIEELFESIDYPDYKLNKTKLMLKRILGRATLTSREAHTLSGLFRKIMNQIKRNQ